MKKVLLVLLTFSLVAILHAATATVNGIKWTYQVSNGEAQLYNDGWSPAISSSTRGAITIPSSLDGYPVTSIGWAAFEGCSSLTSVTIPSSVTSIGPSAFSGCTGLTAVTIPNGVIFTTLPPDVEFSNGEWSGSTIDVSDIGCSHGYRSPSIGDGCSTTMLLKVVGPMDFSFKWKVSSLRNHHYLSWSLDGAQKSSISGTGGDWQTVNCSIPEGEHRIRWTYSKDNDNYMASGLDCGWVAFNLGPFEGCTNIVDVTIPMNITTSMEQLFPNAYATLEKVTLIGDGEAISDKFFAGCASLQAIEIPYGVTSIGSHAFYDCSHLTSVTLPSSVISIGSSAFSRCTSLTSVTIPKGVISIGESVFSGCSNLWKDANGVQYESDEKVILVDVPTSIAGEFVIPNTVRFIHSDAFYGCSSLTSVTLPSSVMSIGRDAFKGCSRLPRDKDGVQYESAAKNVLIFVPSSYYTAIPTIYRGHFTIPSSVRLICSEAFHNHSGLLSVTIPSSVTFIGDSAFENCTGLSSITLREGVMIIGSSAFKGCSGLKSVTIPDSGVVWIGNHAFAGCSALPLFKIPLSVVSIGDSAFEGCERLSAWLPRNFSSMRIIGKRAFYNCVGFEIPSGVTSIGDEAFYNCRFRTVVIPSSVTSIGKDAFSDCRDLMSVTIPSSVTSIGKDAFSGVYPKVLAAAWLPSGMVLWNLTTLIIPEDAPSIGPIVVGGGPLSSLETVIFLGGVPSDILDVQIPAANGYYTPQYAEEWEQVIKDGKCGNLTMSPISALPSEMACEYVISPFGEVFLSFYVNSLSKWEGHAFFELSCHSLTTGKSYKAKSITMTSGIDASGNVGVVKVKWDMAKDGIFLNGEKVKFQVKWLDDE